MIYSTFRTHLHPAPGGLRVHEWGAKLQPLETTQEIVEYSHSFEVR